MSDQTTQSTDDPSGEPTTRRKPRVAVVFGGRSTEHGVSCVSAGSVLAAIDRDRYDVVPVGISREGRWVLAADEPEKLAITGGQLPGVEESGAAVVLAGDPTHRGLVVQEPGSVPQELGEVDVVLPLLHGPYGEDGTLQGLLELAGVPYVGSGVFASAAAMDKGHMKTLLRGAGLPVGPYAVVTARAWDSDKAAVRETVAVARLPGLRQAGPGRLQRGHHQGARPRRARRRDRGGPPARPPGRRRGRRGRAARSSAGCWRAATAPPPEASVPGEIVVGGGHEFYDFAAKYLPDEGTDLVVPADLPDDVVREVQDLSVRAFEALACEGLARVDFFLTPTGLVVNEVNTMPGFTPVSMFPLMWRASGLDYPALVERLVETALARHPGLLR